MAGARSVKKTVSRIQASRKHGVTRDSLLDAGLKLFSEKGFDGTSVTDIEAAVGLKPGNGSFYRHFKSRESLMEEVVKREIENVRRWRTSTRLAEEAGEGQEKLKRGFLQSLEGMEAIKDLINLLAREYGQGRFPGLMAQLKALLLDEGLEAFREEYREDIKNGVLRDLDPRVLSSVVMSSLVGYHLANMYFGTELGGVKRQDFTDGLANLIMSKEGK
jgi:AcrR family transcriptional regulator